MRAFFTVLTGLILSVGMIAVVNPTSANAHGIAPLSISCTPGQGCLYTGPNFDGSVYHVVFSQVGGNHCIDLAGNITGIDNNMESSVETIGSGWHFRFYFNYNCAGDFFDQPDDTSAQWNAFKSNTVSSFKLVQ